MNEPLSDSLPTIAEGVFFVVLKSVRRLRDGKVESQMNSRTAALSQLVFVFFCALPGLSLSNGGAALRPKFCDFSKIRPECFPQYAAEVFTA
jgi:hypothetical protein